MTDIDDFERALLKRSLFSGAIWCAVGVGGGLIGALALALLAAAGVRGLSFYFLMLGWFGICASAAANGWHSMRKATRALRSPTGVASTVDDLDEPIDP